MRKPTRQQQGGCRLHGKKAEIDAMLARLQALSDDHFDADPETIHWGHVGTLEPLCRTPEAHHRQRLPGRRTRRVVGHDSVHVAPPRACRGAWAHRSRQSSRSRQPRRSKTHDQIHRHRAGHSQRRRRATTARRATTRERSGSQGDRAPAPTVRRLPSLIAERHVGARPRDGPPARADYAKDGQKLVLAKIDTDSRDASPRLRKERQDPRAARSRLS